MELGIWVSIGSGNGLLPDGTKPLPESVMIYNQFDNEEPMHVIESSM